MGGVGLEPGNGVECVEELSKDVRFPPWVRKFCKSMESSWLLSNKGGGEASGPVAAENAELRFWGKTERFPGFCMDGLSEVAGSQAS